jgi:hypothetical protein
VGVKKPVIYWDFDPAESAGIHRNKDHKVPDKVPLIIWVMYRKLYTSKGKSMALTESERSELLQINIAQYLKQRGWSIQSQTSNTAVLKRGIKINWPLAIILGIITGGIWFIITAIQLLTTRKKIVTITVDAEGNVVTR